MFESSMYKTKLCMLFEKNGNCPRSKCTFAHGDAELRRPDESSFKGRRHNMDGDLRDRLGRPERRPSLDRSGRRLKRFNGHENPRPFENRRDKDYWEDRRFDERSDHADGFKLGNSVEDRSRDVRNKFVGYNNDPEEQLKDADMDVKILTDDKLRLEASIERKAQEIDNLISRIQELETQLKREKEERQRITSSTKNFVKEYNCFLRAQDDLKRSEIQLQKLGKQLNTYLAGSKSNDMDESVDIVRDEENNGLNLRTACDPENGLQKTSSLSRKRRCVDQYTMKEPGMSQRGEDESVEKEKRPYGRDMVPSKSYSEEESGEWNHEDAINKHSSKEDSRKRRRLSTDKVISSTSTAARAYDDAAEFEKKNPESAKCSSFISSSTMKTSAPNQNQT